MKRDNLHFNFRKIDGYNKPFNFIISEREAGKSTAVILDKAYKAFLEGHTSLFIKRMAVDITGVYISDFENILNKFLETPVKLQYSKGSLKEGIVDILIDNKIFIRIAALSNPVQRLKSLMLPSLKYVIFDEFIVAMHLGEKYLKGEVFKFKEMFNTFQRESPNIKAYFLGNPYSLFNPYFLDKKVNTKLLTRGAIISGLDFVIECYEIIPELKEKILKRNPLYKFDDSYKKYAFDGTNIADQNINLGKMPKNFYLNLLIKIENKYLSIWRNNYYIDFEDRFFCKLENENKYSHRRNTYVLNFNDMVDKTILLSKTDRFKFLDFRNAIEKRQVIFETIEAYYLAQELYNFI